MTAVLTMAVVGAALIALAFKAATLVVRGLRYRPADPREDWSDYQP